MTKLQLSEPTAAYIRGEARYLRGRSRPAAKSEVVIKIAEELDDDGVD